MENSSWRRPGKEEGIMFPEGGNSIARLASVGEGNEKYFEDHVTENVEN